MFTLVKFLALASFMNTCYSFAPITNRIISTGHSIEDSLRTSTKLNASSGPQASLTDHTTWRLRFSLNGVPTKNGRKVGELFNVDVKFIEEEGYGKLTPIRANP